MISENKTFEISVLDSFSKTPLPFFLSIEKRYFICTEANQPFMVKIKAKDKEKVFGAKLFLDGKEAISYKTFKDVGHFFGFKLGNGNYKEFLFDVPPSRESSSLEKAAEELGSVKVEFFETMATIVENRDCGKNDNRNKPFKDTKDYEEFEQACGLESKKFYLRSLSVREGNNFAINVKHKKYLGKTRTEHFIDFSKPLDAIKIFYADFVALQLMGLISLRNVEHLPLIPDLKWDLSMTLVCLEAILGSKKHKEGIFLKDLEEVFHSYSKKNLKDFIQGDLYNYFQTKANVFNINQNGLLKLADREAFKKKFCQIPSIIEKSKYEVSKKNEMDNKSNSVLKIKRQREETYVIKLDD